MSTSDDVATDDGQRDDVLPADVAAVVCAYTLQRWDDLSAAIASLQGQLAPVGEIVVVIDHNEDLLARAQERWPELAVVPSTGVKGLSGARDTGIAVTSAAVVAFLDDDAVAAPDWSRALADAYRPGVLGVGGLVEPAWPAAGRPGWLPEAFQWVVGCSYQGLPEQPSPVRNVIGANMSIRRSVLEKIGGFDSRVGRIGTAATGCEETELYIRARAAQPGGVVIYDPRVRVRHTVSPDRVTWAYYRRRCLGEGHSKAVVARLAGSEAALSAERDYVRKVLPRAFLRGVTGRDPRAGLAVLAGLGLTTAGYVREKLSGAREGHRSNSL